MRHGEEQSVTAVNCSQPTAPPTAMPENVNGICGIPYFLSVRAAFAKALHEISGFEIHEIEVR